MLAPIPSQTVISFAAPEGEDRSVTLWPASARDEKVPYL